MQPDPVGTGAAGPLAISQLTRMQKIKKMRSLGMASGVFSLLSAVILILTLFKPDVMYAGALAVAAICSLLVAIYQGFNSYLGRDIFEPPATRSLGDDAQPDHRIYTPPASVLNRALYDTADLSIPTVTEGTTRTLEPVERQRLK